MRPRPLPTPTPCLLTVPMSVGLWQDLAAVELLYALAAAEVEAGHTERGVATLQVVHTSSRHTLAANRGCIGGLSHHHLEG